MIIAEFIILYIIVAVILKKLFKQKLNNYPLLLKPVRRTIGFILGLIGFITTLGTWGVNIIAVVTALGIIGFLFGLALKDMLSDISSGVLITIRKPFNINDKIEHNTATGIVKSIDLRYTTLQDKSQIHLIPNSKLLSEKITIIKQASSNSANKI